MTDIVFGGLTILLWLMLIAIALLPALRNKIKHWLGKSNLALLVIFVASCSAMLGSLWYSEILNYQPCLLCWYQRIFMYPIALLSLVALLIKDLQALLYFKVLAATGLVISIFHLVQQRLPQTGVSCGAVGQAASCDTLYVNAFNLVTIPAMCATIFVTILYVIYLYQTGAKKAVK